MSIIYGNIWKIRKMDLTQEDNKNIINQYEK